MSKAASFETLCSLALRFFSSVPGSPPGHCFTRCPPEMPALCFSSSAFGHAGLPLMLFPANSLSIKITSIFQGPAKIFSTDPFRNLPLARGHFFPFCLEFVPGVCHVLPFTELLTTVLVGAVTPTFLQVFTGTKHFCASCCICFCADAYKVSREGTLIPFLQLNIA